MAWYLPTLFLCTVCTAVCASGQHAVSYTGTFSLQVPRNETQSLMMTMEAVKELIHSIKTEQDNIKQRQEELKEHLLRRLDSLDVKTGWLLTSGDGSTHRLERFLNETCTVRGVAQRNRLYKNCKELYDNGFQEPGIYVISLDGQHLLDVYCDQDIDGGGWTILQKRQDGSEDFDRDWADFKTGFGNITREFWLGNDNLHLLTKGHDQKLKIELKDNLETAYADYSSFWVEDEAMLFRLHVTSFSGASPPGDAMAYHNNCNFTTRDRDHDAWHKNCAEDKRAGWWYDGCQEANLNGQYGGNVAYKGVNWYKWKGYYDSMTAVRMMVKTKN